MAELSPTSIDQLMREMNAFYQPPDGRCVATPEQMTLLLDRLEAYTDEVQEAAVKEGLDSDTHAAQWGLDMAAWQQRLSHYRRAVEAIPSSEFTTAAGCGALYQPVVAPLLDGIWYEELPGITLSQEDRVRLASGQGHPSPDVTTKDHPGGHTTPKPPDVIMPFSLGNQVLVYKEFQEERKRRFWEDLRSEAEELLSAGRDIVRGVPNFLDKMLRAIPWIVVGAAVIGGVYVYQKLPKRKNNPRSRNPKKPTARAATAKPT